mgnify:CR=1 FL=1
MNTGDFTLSFTNKFRRIHTGVRKPVNIKNKLEIFARKSICYNVKAVFPVTFFKFKSVIVVCKNKTFFIKSLTVDADTLMAQAKSDAVKAECRKVYEAIRYSDPMSNDALASIEGQITVKFAELSDAVKADDVGNVVELASEVVILIGDRNKKAKVLK